MSFNNYSEISKVLNYRFSDTVREISVIFVSPIEIQKQNSEFRGKNDITDVLSYEVDDGVSEVYVCPEYVCKSIERDFAVEEIIRVVVHGCLHTLGYDHSEKFAGNWHPVSGDDDYALGTQAKDKFEKMFEIQEEMVAMIVNNS